MIGGDYMHARMLLAPLFLLVLPVLLVPATPLNFGVVSMIALWAVLALSTLRVPFDGGGTAEGIDTRNIRLEDEKWTKRANPTTVADWLNGFAWLPYIVDRAALTPGPVLMYGPEDSIAAPARADAGVDVAMTGGFLGVTGSVAPLDYRVVDMFGLTYPIGGHFELADRGDLPGHEKLLSVIWLFADYADPGAQAQGRLPAVALQVSIAAARRALNCGELQELQESVREPMSWHRCHKNLVGSLRRTQLRIPLDPFTAEARFCRDPH
jgi:arabinofuranosyltransferase